MTIVDSGRTTMRGYLEGLVSRGQFAHYFTDDVVLEIVGADQGARGRQAVEATIRYMHEQAFDSRLDVKSLLVDGERAALEAEFVARHVGEFADKPASGREVRVPYMVIYDLAADRIAALRIYGFMDILVRQL